MIGHLTGRFHGVSRAPQLQCQIRLPRFDIADDISFLVDTGADSCVLMPADAQRLGVPFGQLRNLHTALGVTGGGSTYLEPAALLFYESRKTLFVYKVALNIAEPKAELMDLPSLLGRDVLNRWRMDYRPRGNSLRFTVESADHWFQLDKRKR